MNPFAKRMPKISQSFFFFLICSDKCITFISICLALICPWAATARTNQLNKRAGNYYCKTACQVMSTSKYCVKFLVFSPISHPQKRQSRTRKGSRKDNNSDQRDETASIRRTTKLLRTVQLGRDNLILYSCYVLEKVNSQWLFFYKSLWELKLYFWGVGWNWTKLVILCNSFPQDILILKLYSSSES